MFLPPPPEPVVEPVVPKPIVNTPLVPQRTRRPVVYTTPTPASIKPQPSTTPKPDIPVATIPDVIITPEPEVIPEPPPVMTRHTMVFPEGVSLLHLPIESQITHLSSLFGALGDSVNVIAALRPTVQFWAVVTSENPRVNEWISSYRGLLVDMESEMSLELVGIERPNSYATIYVKQGRNLIGVPRQSNALETVGDLYRRFPGVTSVKGLDSEIDFMLPIQDDWFVELDRDTVIDGTTGYMIESDTDSQYTVWGTQWTVTAYAAPGVFPMPRNIVTSWGAIKNGGRL